MDEKVESALLKDFTTAVPDLAIAECVPNLLCVIYADGQELGPWTDAYLPEELRIYRAGGKITSSDSEFSYWVLQWNGAREFQVSEGPFDTDQLKERISQSRRTSAKARGLGA
jgi:hypothetical protein